MLQNLQSHLHVHLNGNEHNQSISVFVKMLYTERTFTDEQSSRLQLNSHSVPMKMRF